MAKQWFVILRQAEVEKFKNAYERLVYEGVKSFCGNGKIESSCSTHEIAKRASISQSTVSRYLPILLSKKYIIQTGVEYRVGGAVPVYKVILAESVRDSDSITLATRSDSHSRLSDSPSSESDSDTASYQSKVKSKKGTPTQDFSKSVDDISNGMKSFEKCSPQEIWDIAWELKVELQFVAEKHQKILDMTSSGEMQERYPHYKNTYQTLLDWVQQDLSKGYVTQLDEVGLMALQASNPSNPEEIAFKKKKEQLKSEGKL